MKKLLLLLLVVLAASCVKDLTSEMNPADESKFMASFESVSTRTQVDSEWKQSWTADDHITVFKTVTNAEYKFDGKTGDREGTFSPVSQESAGTALSVNYAVYPYAAATSISSDEVISYTLPSTQEIKDGTFAMGTNLMTAVTTSVSDRVLKFRNACGYIVLNLHADNFTLKELRFRGNDQEVLAGEATIAFDTDRNPVLVLAESGATELTLTSKDGIKLGTTAQDATELWIVLPPQELAHGFTIEMIDSADNHMSKVTSNAVTVARNEVIDMRELDVDGCLPGEFKRTTARWEMTSTIAKSVDSEWISNNHVYATNEDGKGKAYISTVAGGTASSPVRGRDGNTLVVSNLTEGDCIHFTYPGITAAKGSTVDFMCSMYSTSKYIPKYWLCEFFEEGQWVSVEEDLHSATEDPNVKFTMYLYSSDSQKSNMVQSFTLRDDMKNEDLKIRLRAVGNINAAGSALSPTSGAYVVLANAAWNLGEIDIYQGCPIRDTKKVLVIGNSFTQYQSSNFMLKRIARTQGHEIRMRPFMKGGQAMAQYCTLEMSQAAVNEGGYDYSILQDQSGQHAKYYTDPTANAYVLSDTKTLLGQIEAKSPAVLQILENTWAYLGANEYEGYGSMEAFDAALQCGALAITKATTATMSPIGIAFQKAREQGINSLYVSDNKHPSRIGSYLKSCVNYLMIYGQKFDANVPDCDIDPTLASRLRAIAEDVVIGGYEINYFVVGEPTKTTFTTEGGTGSSKIDTNLEYTVTCDKEWVTLEKQDGLVSWTVAANTDKASRGATITFTPDGASVKTISLVQAGTEAPGGISSKEELLDFANLVNTKGDFTKYMNPDGEVILKADIDMTGVSWTPIGNSTAAIDYTVNVAPTNPFVGIFDGKGHKIKNLSVKIMNNATSYMGFFGATMNAEIRNLTFENLDMEFTTKGITTNHVAFGGVVAYAYNTKFSYVTVTVNSHGTATSTASRAVSYGGITGIMYATAAHSAGLDHCTTNGQFTNDIGLKYSNTSTVQYGGIIGAVSSKSKLVKMNFCHNYADFTVKGHKCGGIIGNAFCSEIENCNNYGNIDINYSKNAPSSVTIKGVRVGGIMAYCSSTTTNDSNLLGCSNYGTISTEQEGSAAGGVAGLIRCYWLRECHNLGNVIAPAPVTDSQYRGLLVGAITYADDPSRFESCSLRGWIGSKKDLSDAVEAGEDNYLELGVTMHSQTVCPSWNSTNIRFALEQ